MIAPIKLQLTLAFCAIAFTSALRTASAQQTNAVGLPVVQENYGLENPPDLPELPSLANQGVNTAPAQNQPSTGQTSAGSGGVLSTLDNIPPVGASVPSSNAAGRSYTPQLPDPVRNQQNAARQGQVGTNANQGNQPKVVRFGDVRNEAEARRQFPDLAPSPNRPGADNPAAPRLPETQPPTGLAKYNPLRLLNRFNPLRLDKPEPPLVQKTAGPDDEKVDNTITGDSAANRVLQSDRTDSEIQKRVDKLIREEFGNKTNDFNVEVINREVYIKARPNWFWQRRQLSDDLQKLPGIDSKRLHITVY